MKCLLSFCSGKYRDGAKTGQNMRSSQSPIDAIAGKNIVYHILNKIFKKMLKEGVNQTVNIKGTVCQMIIIS